MNSASTDGLSGSETVQRSDAWGCRRRRNGRAQRRREAAWRAEARSERGRVPGRGILGYTEGARAGLVRGATRGAAGGGAGEATAFDGERRHSRNREGRWSEGKIVNKAKFKTPVCKFNFSPFSRGQTKNF